MRSNALVYVISILAALFIGWSIFNPHFNSSMEYLLILVFFVMLTWIILVIFVPDRRERNYIFSIFLLALFLRILFSFLIHTLLPLGYFAPDEPGTLMNGKIIAESWSGNAMQHNFHGGIYVIAGAAFYIFGYKPNILFLLANFLGAMTVLNAYFITKRLFNEQSARYSALVVTILPSLILWSSMPLKDVYSQFLITFIIHLTLRVKKRFRLNNVAIIIALIALVGFVRSYLMLIVLVAIAGTFIPVRKETFLRNTIIITMFAMAFVVFFSSYSAKQASLFGNTPETTFQTLQQTRQSFYSGGSKMLGHINVASPVNALFYLPLLLAAFFLAPFPWDVTGSMLHNLATAESLVWYYLFYYAIKAIIRSFKEGNFDTLPVLVMVGVLSIAYALAISNMGAAYRFRGQVSVLLLVFTGYGLYLRKQKHLKIYPD